MSQELVYTSAPQGLLPGSQGFATVAATRGLSSAWREALEGLCGYRPLFPPEDPRNPVAFAHLKLVASGEARSVLARVGPGGLDYSGRPNKFAHLLVLNPGERPAAGPAWVLARPGVMETAWDGRVGWRDRGRPIPDGETLSGVCTEWQSAAGDAGWAGVLAEAFQNKPERPAVLLFAPGTDVLPLINEALRLLPSARRWEVTFSTYAASLPPTIGYSWRGLVLGTPEAKTAARLPGALVLNLSESLGPAVGGPLVEAARTGRMPAVAAAPVEEYAPVPAPVFLSRPLPATPARPPAVPLGSSDWPEPQAESVVPPQLRPAPRAVSRMGPLVACLFLLILLGGVGTWALVLLLWPPDRPGTIDTSQPALVQNGGALPGTSITPPPPPPPSLPPFAIATRYAIVNAEPLARHLRGATEYVKGFFNRTRVAAANGGPPGPPPAPPVVPLRTFHQVDLRRLQGTPAETVVADLTKAFGADQSPDAQLRFVSEGNLLMSAPEEGANRLVVKAKRSTISQGIEEFMFVKFWLGGDKINFAKLESADGKADSNHWSELFDSLLEIRTGRGEVPRYIALRLEHHGTLRASHGTRRNEEYFLLGWDNSVFPAKEELHIDATSITKKDVEVKMYKKGKDKPPEIERRDVAFRGSEAGEDKRVRLSPVLGEQEETAELLFVTMQRNPARLVITNADKSVVSPSDVRVDRLELFQTVGGIKVPVFRVNPGAKAPDQPTGAGDNR